MNRQPPSLLAEIREQVSEYGKLMRIHQPIGIWLLMWPTLWGLWIAGEGRPDAHVLIVFAAGVVVMRSAGCVINDYFDRHFDHAVARTRERPITAGRVAPFEALVLFGALLALALALVMTLNPLTQALAVGGALLAVIYPLTKRFVSAPQLVLGCAFGWGVPMAFAAQTGELPKLAWLIWLCVAIWAVIYDTMYAMADREDDRRIGIRSTAILFGSADLFMISMLMATLMFALLLVGRDANLAGWYHVGLVAGACIFVYQLWLIRDREPAACLKAFRNNRWFGAAVFAGIALHYLYLPPAG